MKDAGDGWAWAAKFSDTFEVQIVPNMSDIKHPITRRMQIIDQHEGSLRDVYYTIKS